MGSKFNQQMDCSGELKFRFTYETILDQTLHKHWIAKSISLKIERIKKKLVELKDYLFQ